MPDPVGQESSAVESLSPYAEPYVTEMLGKGQALASTPYEAYTGALTAGPSELQNQAYEGIGSLAMPTASIAGDFTGSTAQSYMSPYISAALEPQMAEAQRQAEIQRVMNAGRLSKAGAFGGGRQAIMESEGQRNLLRNLTDIYGTGMQTAYEQGLGQFNKDRGYGLGVLGAQRQAGAEQRAIEKEGIAADIAQFREERDYPYKQVQYMSSLLQGLPIEAVSREYIEPSDLSTFLSYLGLLGNAGQLFFGQGAAPGGQAPGLFTSDMRLKENITHVGVLPNGANWYTWDWNDKGKAIAGNQPTQGVMAQEIQKTNPDAVTTDSDGYLRVDYSKV